jgi:NADH-quinone oxidoreductase subunit J
MLESLLSNVPLSFHVFMLFATITVAGAGGVAFSRNIVYAAFSLLACFSGVVGLFAFMSADFLAVVQLMVYVGGILVLILFAVMLTNKITDVKNSNPTSHVPVGAVLLTVTLITLLTAVLGYDWPVRDAPPPYAPTSALIGDAFLGPYLLPFEVAGILLLAALLAAVVVARKEIRDDPTEEDAA